MVWIDFVIIALLIYAAWTGWRQGLVTQAVGLAAIGLGIFLAWRFGPTVGEWLGVRAPAAAVAGFAVVVVVVVVAAAILGRLTRGFFRIAGLGVFDTLLGSVFSIFKTLLVVGLALWLVETLDVHGKVLSPRVREQSTMLHAAQGVVEAVCPFVKNIFE